MEISVLILLTINKIYKQDRIRGKVRLGKEAGVISSGDR